jgi:cytochrome b
VRWCDGADNKAKAKSAEDDESEIKVEVQHPSHCCVGLNLVLAMFRGLAVLFATGYLWVAHAP